MDWQVSIDDIDEITKKISVSINQERVAREFDVMLNRVSRSAHIKGFRKGKVPRKMVEQMLGDRIRMDVASSLINESLRKVYEENKLEVVGEPRIDLEKIEATSPLDFKATVSIFPRPVISNYKNRTVEVVKREVTEDDVQQALERVRESKAELKAIEDRKDAQKGDVVALSVSVQVENNERSRPEPFVDVLGSGKLNDEVEKQLEGLTVGENKEVTVTAPEDHTNAELRGKPVTYHIQLHGIFSKTLPELSDEFAKGVGLGVETAEALKEQLKARLVQQAEDETQNDIHGTLLDLLVAENPFKIPESMVDDEIRGIVARYGVAGGSKPENIDVTPYRAQFEDFALNRIRCAILIDSVGELEAIKVDEADREKMIERMAAQSGSTVEATRKTVHDRNRLMSFLLEVRRTKILEFLVANTTVSYKSPESPAKAA